MVMAELHGNSKGKSQSGLNSFRNLDPLCFCLVALVRHCKSALWCGEFSCNWSRREPVMFEGGVQDWKLKRIGGLGWREGVVVVFSCMQSDPKTQVQLPSCPQFQPPPLGSKVFVHLILS